ncbi:hypothetical protein, partial [Pedobacter sp.]|uniref:hypothetical protein n=1 Tax=Pedobacter sp. TaxID=1411316 RepID=UPI002B680BD4
MRGRNLLCPHGIFYALVLVFVLLFQSLMMSAVAQAITTRTEKTYSIGFKNEPILKVFIKIENISGLKFSYNQNDIKAVHPIKIVEKERNIIQLLKELSAKSGLNFSISRGIVAVTPNVEFSYPEEKTNIIQKKTTDTVIHGSVLDTLNKPLVGVS